MANEITSAMQSAAENMRSATTMLEHGLAHAPPGSQVAVALAAWREIAASLAEEVGRPACPAFLAGTHG